MGIGGSPKIPAVAPQPPAAAPATLADPTVAASAAANRQRAISAAAAGGTLGANESAQGFAAPSTAGASLLGQTK